MSIKIFYIHGNICAGKNFISEKLHSLFQYPIISVDDLYGDINESVDKDSVINRVIEIKLLTESIYNKKIVINTSSRHLIRYNDNAINLFIYCDEGIRQNRYIKRYGSLNGYMTKKFKYDYSYENNEWNEDNFIDEMCGLI